MFMLDPPYLLWSIWRGLSLLQRLFIELLCVISAYCLFASFRTALRLRAIEKQDSNERTIPIDGALAPLYRSLANTRRIIGATFYLFGFFLFFCLQLIVNTLGGKDFPLKQIFGSFVLCCAFAANVFFIFLVLHVAEWLVYIMLNRCSKRLNGGPRGRENKVSAVGT
jgi:hypothetical protein